MIEDIYKKLPKHISAKIYSSYKHPPYMLERELISNIKLMDETKALSILKRINSLERACLSEMPINSLRYSLVASCTLFTRAIIEAGVDSELAFMVSDMFINEIDKHSTLKEIEKLEYDMLIEFIRILKTNKEYLYNPIVNKAISYIKKNIESKLSVEELAEHLNIHPNYLSSVFSKEVGVSLTTYIASEKISSVKHFLVETNISLNEIAYIFNFSSQAHFSKYFKDNVGLTPLKYRNLFSINN